MQYEQQPLLNPEQMTIGEIVTQNYHTAGIFRQFGLDFCCGGGVLLSEACKKKGIDFDSLLSEIKTVTGSGNATDENYQNWSPGFLIDYIINTHHQFVREKTEEISAYASKVARVHGERHPENVEIFNKFAALSNELTEHMEAEENTVFPLIKQAAEKAGTGEKLSDEEMNTLQEQLTLMIQDHEGAGQLISEIRLLSNNFTPPADACATYRILYQNLAGFEENLHKHVHLENNILFKKATEIFNSQYPG